MGDWSVAGKEILPYVGPRPPVGIHRFIMVLFQQKGPLGVVEKPASRANFNTRLFARHLDLGLPVATIYFNSQKEPASRRRWAMHGEAVQEDKLESAMEAEGCGVA